MLSLDRSAADRSLSPGRSLCGVCSGRCPCHCGLAMSLVHFFWVGSLSTAHGVAWLVAPALGVCVLEV